METLAEQGDTAAQEEPPGGGAEEDAGEDEQHVEGRIAAAEIQVEEGEQAEHQDQGAGVGDRHQQAAADFPDVPGTQGFRTGPVQVLDRVLQGDLEADQEDDRTADEHHPVVVPIQEFADERNREQGDRRIEGIGDRRADADGETGPAALVQRLLDADDAQRPERDRSRQSDEDRFEEIEYHCVSETMTKIPLFTTFTAKNLSL